MPIFVSANCGEGCSDTCVVKDLHVKLDGFPSRSRLRLKNVLVMPGGARCIVPSAQTVVLVAIRVCSRSNQTGLSCKKPA